LLTPQSTLLDVGCGRTAPVLRKFAGRAGRLVGVDLVEFENTPGDLELHRGDASDIRLPSASVNVIMARSVMEHLTHPVSAFKEMHRVLAPGGSLVFLTANLWDYASLIARVVPNAWHPTIVQHVEGRAPEDVFPIAYRCNTKGAIRRLAANAGYDVSRFDYLGQYPGYFLFNGPLFLVATGYEKILQRVSALGFLRGWILAVLVKRAT
jgi:SAM-dependent methyltransferase